MDFSRQQYWLSVFSKPSVRPRMHHVASPSSWILKLGVGRFKDALFRSQKLSSAKSRRCSLIFVQAQISPLVFAHCFCRSGVAITQDSGYRPPRIIPGAAICTVFGFDAGASCWFNVCQGFYFLRYGVFRGF